jgi:hypothetical protein
VRFSKLDHGTSDIDLRSRATDEGKSVYRLDVVMRPVDCFRETGVELPVTLSQIPDTLLALDHSLVIRVSLLRDFLPGSPPNGRPLDAIISLVDLNAQPLSRDVQMEHLWILRDGQVLWSAAFSIEPTGEPSPDQQRRLARCGPRVEPGILVDVVVRVEGLSEQPQYIKALGVYVKGGD